MQKNIKKIAFFALLCLIVYVVFTKYNNNNSNTAKYIQQKKIMKTMPAAAAMPTNTPIDLSKDIDRQSLVKESTELVPANEVIQMNYKGLDGSVADLDKELFANDAPLFQLSGPVNLIPLDVNVEHRRVNFY